MSMTLGDPVCEVVGMTIAFHAQLGSYSPTPRSLFALVHKCSKDNRYEGMSALGGSYKFRTLEAKQIVLKVIIANPPPKRATYTSIQDVCSYVYIHYAIALSVTLSRDALFAS